MAMLFGQHLVSFNCKASVTKDALSRLFVGTFEDGSFICLDNFHYLSKELFSLLNYYFNIVKDKIAVGDYEGTTGNEV